MRRPAAFARPWDASRTVIAVLLATGAIAAPVTARATGFNGTPTVASGAATFSTSGSTQTIQLNAVQTIINWAPTDTATSAAPIAFLGAGQTVAYTPQSVDLVYTVLNRILPTDTTRAIGLNGTITSTSNINTWFYSPGGFLIGANAVFNVGGLLLSASDPVTTTNPTTGAVSFVTQTGNTEQFSVAGAAGSTSAITIQAGAQINVATAGRSAYMVAIAPQISNAGTLNVAGSTALVAAESASFTVDPAGLFTIAVSAGSTVASNTFVNTGSVGSSDSVANGATYARRVYMVAVPKNNAVTMAIASGGTIGFAPAGAAAMDGNEIVLSAGANIADTGTGNPISTTPAGTGAANLAIGAGTYSANLYAGSTGSLTVTDPAGNIAFLSDLTLVAPQTAVHAATGTISVAGNLSLLADNTQQGTSGSGNSARVTVDSGATLAIGASAAALGVNGDLVASASDSLGGLGGTAQIGVAGGALTVAGNARVNATASWAAATQNPGLITTTGGTANATVSAGGKLTVGGLLAFDASADGTNADAVYNATAVHNGVDFGYYANAGSTGITVTGAGSTVMASGGLAGAANATAASNFSGNSGGFANAALVQFEADAGGTLQIGASGQLVASAVAVGGGGSAVGAATNGGLAHGGVVRLIANGGTVAMQGPGAITLAATAQGGNGAGGIASVGGPAIGGTALIETQGANGLIVTNTSGGAVGGQGAMINVSALGGTSGDSGAGGAATAGTANIVVTGAGQSITLGGTPVLSVLSVAQGGSGNGGGGGAASGGTAGLSVTGGSFSTTGLATFSTAATGGGDSAGNGGAASGGNVLIGIDAGGTLQTPGGANFSAFANGGSAYTGGGGAALGGNVLIDAVNPGSFDFGASTGGIAIDTSYTGGIGATIGNAASAGGARLRTTGSYTLNGALAMVGNTTLRIEAGGNIGVTGTVIGTGAGAALQLWADTTGTGAGTVTLAGNAINLSGTGATVDIDYNPTALGTPTNYAPGVAAGLLTAYQLVDTVSQLQQVGGFLTQNFALGRNIDASATQGWNGGAGFVPIGSLASPYLGNFDGLGHTITNLFIDQTAAPASGYLGLFGAVGMVSGTGQTFRNVGLVNAQISGTGANIGGLIGTIANDAITVSNSFVTGGTITGGASVGGLIGTVNGNGSVLTNVHSDAAVVVTTSAGKAGGLVGSVGDVAITISRAFATGAVTATATNTANVGGLVGVLAGGSSLADIYASGSVTVAGGSTSIGGLIGYLGPTNTLTEAYATGTVTAGSGSANIGGLVGRNAGSIGDSWSSAPVAAVSGTNVGGFVGWNNGGSIAASYWDHFSSGQAIGVGNDTSSTTQLSFVTSNPAEITAGMPSAYLQSSYAQLTAANWVYDLGMTRPLGAWEVPVAQYLVAPVSSAHQVQLIDQNLAGSYLITQNIDMAGTARQSEIWQNPGFMPIASSGTFTGTIAGGGHVLSNLSFDPTFELDGLIALNAGSITDLGLWNATLTSPNGLVAQAGLLAAQSEAGGTIFDSFATGTLNAPGATSGGLVGINNGTIAQSYASVAIVGAQLGGGLVGSNTGMITTVFANGAVGASQAGGLIGANTAPAGSVTSAYWDTQVSGLAVGCGISSSDCSGISGLTTAQTQQVSSFAGFAIDSSGGQGLPWRIYAGSTTPLLEAFLQPVIVQPQSLTQVYNATVPVLGVTTYGADPALLFGSAQIGGLTKNAGTSAITYGGGLYSNQIGYDLVPSASPGTLIITPAALTLTAISQTRTYDATTASNGVVQVAGLFGSDTVTNLTQAFDSANAGSRTLSVNAGYVVNDGNNGGNYTVTLNSAAGTITPAALTLSAVSQTRTYDSTTASNGVVQVTGLFGSDTVTNLTQAFDSANAGPRTLSVNAGYVVNDGNSGGNYTVTLNSAAGSITPAALTLSAVSQTRTYDSTSASNGVVQVAGLFGSDTVTNLTQAFDSANAGPRTLSVNAGYVVNDGNGGGNYTVTRVTAQGSITPALLTLNYTANPATSTYGDALPGLTGSYTLRGLQGEDSAQSVLSGTAVFATMATATSNVGTYAITGSGLKLVSGNYSLNVIQQEGNGGALKITPRPITVTAQPASRVFGQPNPPLTYVVTGPGDAPGLVNGDQLTGALATAATRDSPAGTYAITQGTLAASANYALTYVGSTLTVTVSLDGIDFIVTSVDGGLPGSSGGDGGGGTDPKRRRHLRDSAIAAPRGVLLPAWVPGKVFDDDRIRRPRPVDEPVSIDGDPSLWRGSPIQ